MGASFAGRGRSGKSICARLAMRCKAISTILRATGQAFDAEGWHRSGDLARLDEDGYMYVVDRLKDMDRDRRRERLFKEVEDAISAHPDVQDVAVVGQPHPEWGETVTALLVARPGRKLDESAMQAFLSARLARYKIPRIFQVRDALPRTPTGKLKHVLRAEAHPETTPVQIRSRTSPHDQIHQAPAQAISVASLDDHAIQDAFLISLVENG